MISLAQVLNVTRKHSLITTLLQIVIHRILNGCRPDSVAGNRDLRGMHLLPSKVYLFFAYKKQGPARPP